MTDASITALAEVVRQRHVLVAGGGIAGLVSALELAKVGLQVTLVEATDRLGGTVGAVEIAGVTVDVPAEGFAVRGDAVRSLAQELDLDVVRSNPLELWIAVAGRGIAGPVPPQSVVGIPANPWDEGVRRLIGWGGTWRAYLDRLRPPLTIGQERSLGKLVRTRMGAAVLERLVAPVSEGLYGIHPDDVDVEIAAPGLSTALTRTGSLQGGVGQVLGDEVRVHVQERVAGGVSALIAALGTRLHDLGVDVRLQAQAVALAPDAHGRWVAALVTPDGTESATFDGVVVATPEFTARSLLAAHVPALDAEVEQPPVTEVVTLVVDAPALDVRPRGDAVFAAGGDGATGLVVSTLRWPDLAAGFPASRHVLRVSFGTESAPPATAALDDVDAAKLALSQAELLLGVTLAPVASRRDVYAIVRPGSALGRRDSAQALREAVRTAGGLGVTGAWLSGPGLAQVIPDAVAEADRVRAAVLWGGAATRQ